MAGIEDLLDGRRAALMRGSEAWSAKVEADRLKGEADEVWGSAWKGMLAAGFSEKELRGAGMVPPGEEGRKRRAPSRSRRVEVGGRPMVVDEEVEDPGFVVVPDGQDDGLPG